MATENLRDCSASGVVIRDEYLQVSSRVSLRIVSFTPPSPSAFPAVVFVAGWISQMQGWKKVLREMTKDFCVYYVETREKISSRISGSARFGVEEIGGDILPLVQRLQLRDYLLFGSSLGATAIIDCYQFLKPKPRAMVLVAPNAVFRVPLPWKTIITFFYAPLYALLRPFVKWYLRTFRLNVAADAAQYEKYSEALDAADPRKLKKAVKAVWKYEVWDKLSSIDCPVLLVNASKDRLHEPGNMKRIVAGLRNVVEIDLETNSRTHNTPVVDAMRTFLQKIGPKAPS